MMAPYDNSKSKNVPWRRTMTAAVTAAVCLFALTGCKPDAPPPITPDRAPSCTQLTAANERPELHPSYTGKCVRVLEDLLMDIGYLSDDYMPISSFGVEVKQAVIDFQRDHDLTADGVVGPQTWPKLVQVFEEKQLTPVITETDPPEATESTVPSEAPSPSPTPKVTPPASSAPPSESPSPSELPSSKPPATKAPKPSPTVPPKSTAPPTKEPAYDYRFGPNTTKHVMLTFDDCSYSLKKSNAVIKAAKDLGVSVVFAVEGQCVEHGYFDVDTARAAGHFVINHSYDHPAFLSMSYDKIMAQLNHGEFKTNYARTPYGQGSFHEKGSEKILKALKDSNMRLWTWSIDSNDWGEPAPNASGPKTLDQIIARINRDLPSKAAVAANRGDTILLHMNHKSFTPEGIKRLVKVVESKGLTVCPNSGKPTPVFPTEQDFCR